MVNGLWRRWLNRLPASCLLCEAPADAWGLCEPCLQDLPWNRDYCLTCALPLPEGLCNCSHCRAAVPLQERTLAPLRYEFPANHLISRLKYGGRLIHAPVLGELLTAAVADHPGPLPDLLLPAPLHPRRLAARGYNQAMEIARPVARYTGLPLETRLLERIRATRAQMTLDREARADNPAGAFAVDPRRLDALGDGVRVALIDDVMTTGATLDEMARTLLQAGVASVEYWVVARTP
ncbi:MAG TPA: ComF family protein [Moraxellaceae bacterium]|nr:ComF family protein [Moraxellaceae bacterium]